MIYIILWVIVGSAIIIWSITGNADFKVSDLPILLLGVVFGPFTIILLILFWFEDHPEVYKKTIFKQRKKDGNE